MYYEKLTKQYPISKTLRYELRPMGKTLENIRANLIIESDEKRKKDYEQVKKIFDRYHKLVIDSSLQNVTLSHLNGFAEFYFKNNKSDADVKAMKAEQIALRKEIVDALKKHESYGILEKKEIIQVLNHFVTTEEEHDALSSFTEFFTYMKGYTSVRANLYSADEKSSTVAYRLIHENFPRFLDNTLVYKGVKANDLSVDGLDEETMDSLFMVETYNHLLTQEQIDLYNSEIGKINSVINHYNQQHKQAKKLPILKTLYKQIMSDRAESFIIEFSNDDEVVDCLQEYILELENFVASEDFHHFFDELRETNGQGVYVKNNMDLTTMSTIVADSWHHLSDLINYDYDVNYHGKKSGEKYEEEKNKLLKKVNSYELGHLMQLGQKDIVEKYANRLLTDVEEIHDKAKAFREEIGNHDAARKLAKNTAAVDAIKEVLDAVKTLERDVKLLAGCGEETDKNLTFYGFYDVVLQQVAKVDSLYNLTRNYMTKKPFSTEKIKLNFNRATLLDGWDRNKEEANLGVLLTKDQHYYLGVMNTTSNKVFRNIPVANSNDRYQKVEYKLLPGPNKMLPKVFFAESNLEQFTPSEEILAIRKKESFKKGDTFSLSDCQKFIDFFKESIQKHEDWSKFNFVFSDTRDYADISGFYREVEKQGYKITYTDVDASYIDHLVDTNQLYLFEIYNKDFSPYSKGNLNLHTLYFKMLFDQRNLDNVVYKLNGEAEIFYRPASIQEDEMVVHPAGEPIENKNVIRRASKPASVLPYDVIKDRRYTTDKFMLHIPITMNFGTDGGRRYNDLVNNVLRTSENVHVIGIDRGERNLLYVVVVDPDGKIVEQISLNSIVNEEYQIETNYHQLLVEKENSRDKARKDWKTIENIKDLKEGYLSQVAHVVAELIIKYNAIVCLEDLNVGFMRGRQKVERQVYQKFEKMLIDKLNYLVIDKDRNQVNPEKIGGALNALQLTAPFTSFKEMGKQTGIIYYVPAYLTSKIDPTTGFSNLFYVKYENMEAAKVFFDKFEDIRYNAVDKYFEFGFDYNAFTTRAEGTKTRWTVCSYGKRIKRFRSEKINNNWDEEEVDLTAEFSSLFEQYGLTFEDGKGIKEAILAIDEPKFYKKLTELFKLMLQMRNSSNDGTKDYIISPVKNEHNVFFDSSSCNATLPKDADANGAYNIARKGLWVLEQIINSEEDAKIRLAMTNKEWIDYAQKHKR